MRPQIPMVHPLEAHDGRTPPSRKRLLGLMVTMQDVLRKDHTNVTPDIATRITRMYGVLPIFTFEGIQTPLLNVPFRAHYHPASPFHDSVMCALRPYITIPELKKSKIMDSPELFRYK